MLLFVEGFAGLVVLISLDFQGHTTLGNCGNELCYACIER